MIKKEQKVERDYLCRAIAAIETIDECRDFLDDVCTIKEIESIAQRLTVANLLNKGKTFNEIVEETGASTATISRVNKCLNYGSGYKQILEKLG